MKKLTSRIFTLVIGLGLSTTIIKSASTVVNRQVKANPTKERALTKKIQELAVQIEKVEIEDPENSKKREDLIEQLDANIVKAEGYLQRLGRSIDSMTSTQIFLVSAISVVIMGGAEYKSYGATSYSKKLIDSFGSFLSNNTPSVISNSASTVSKYMGDAYNRGASLMGYANNNTSTNTTINPNKNSWYNNPERPWNKNR